MLNFPPRTREIAVLAILEDDRQAFVATKEYDIMGPFNIVLSERVTDGGHPFSDDESRRYFLDSEKLGILLSLTNALLPEWDKASRQQGGTLDVTLRRQVTSSDATPVPADANGSPTFSGLTRKSLVRVQRAQHRIVGRLLDESEKHADKHAKKHGKGNQPPGPGSTGGQ